MSFFLTLFIQLANGWSPLRTGLSYIPFEAGTHTSSLEAAGSPPPVALVEGFQRAFLVGVGMLVCAALVAPLIGRVRADRAALPV